MGVWCFSLLSRIRMNKKTVRESQNLRKIIRYLISEIKREEMPQVSRDNLPKAVKWMRDNGTDVELTKKPASELKPTQEDLEKDKVKNMTDKFDSVGDIKALVVSNDGYIIDGHHRWAAAKVKFGEDVKLPVAVIDEPKQKALNTFTNVSNSVQEVPTLVRPANPTFQSKGSSTGLGSPIG